MSAGRLACLCVPFFPLAARLRGEPELKDEPLVILSGNGNGARVLAASRDVRRAGIGIGQSVAQARTILPRLLVRAHDPLVERSAQEALLEAAEHFSPRVEDAAPGLVFLDVDGLERLFSGSGQEHSLGQSLMTAAGSAGLPARAGIASSKLAARIAAEQPTSPCIVPPGEEAAFLAPLPLGRLGPTGDAAQTLERWGLKTIGDLARLAEGDLASRLGEEGVELSRRARGVDPRPLIPRTVPQLFDEGMQLEWPLVAVEPFLFLARPLLERLTVRLAGQALACRRLDLALTLEPDGEDIRSLDLSAPTLDVKALLTLLRLNIEGRPPGSPVVALRLVAYPDRPRRAQLSLFGSPALSPEKLDALLIRLEALLGPGRAGSPRLPDSYRPEAFRLEPFDPPAPPDLPRPPREDAAALSVRTLRPPLELEVVVNEKNVPASLRSEVSSGRQQIAGAVRVASGPWRMEEEWCNPEQKTDRDYWDIELAPGGLYRIYEERLLRRWFADGIYD